MSRTMGVTLGAYADIGDPMQQETADRIDAASSPMNGAKYQI